MDSKWNRDIWKPQEKQKPRSSEGGYQPEREEEQMFQDGLGLSWAFCTV